MQKVLQEESSFTFSGDPKAKYSVWVSFAEIYNENVYDLLSNDCQKRQNLNIVSDAKGRMYIKDLSCIHVTSGTEAYQVLMAGQYNLKIAATGLNAKSSRSHCLFTIKLLKYYDNDDPRNVTVST